MPRFFELFMILQNHMTLTARSAADIRRCQSQWSWAYRALYPRA